MPKKDEVKSVSQGRGLTPKQEKFCQKYIEMGNASEAYRQAYDCSKMKPETIKRKAQELLENGTITATFIKELKETHQQRHNITVDNLLGKLERIYNEAMDRDTPQFSSAVNAVMGQAKILGLDTPLSVELRKAQIQRLEQDVVRKTADDKIQFIQEFD